MIVRYYAWHKQSSRRRRVAERLHVAPRLGLRVGNAGDLYARDVIEHLYGAPVCWTDTGGHRLLVIGSIAHKVQPGDVLCGVGVKSSTLPIPVPPDSISIRGLRGPISAEIMASKGFDVSNVRSLLDPGLLIRFDLEEELNVDPTEGPCFIPHYRERHLYGPTVARSISVVDVDCRPLELGRRILRSDLVYTSSLHGLVFAHALGRPAILVRPQTPEELTKYEDYTLSVGLSWTEPPTDVFDALGGPKPTSPPTLRFRRDSFAFPAAEDLPELGIAQSTTPAR